MAKLYTELAPWWPLISPVADYMEEAEFFLQVLRAAGLPVYAETLHQYACFDAEHYRTPRGFCAHTYPSLKLPEDREALWRGLCDGGVQTLATDEYPTSLAVKLRGRTIEDVTGGNLGAEARLGIAFTEGEVKRGMSLERFAAVTATNAARIFGLYPRKGVIAPGSDADLVLIDPDVRKTRAGSSGWGSSNSTPNPQSDPTACSICCHVSPPSRLRYVRS